MSVHYRIRAADAAEFGVEDAPIYEVTYPTHQGAGRVLFIELREAVTFVAGRQILHRQAMPVVMEDDEGEELIPDFMERAIPAPFWRHMAPAPRENPRMNAGDYSAVPYGAYLVHEEPGPEEAPWESQLIVDFDGASLAIWGVPDWTEAFTYIACRVLLRRGRAPVYIAPFLRDEANNITGWTDPYVFDGFEATYVPADLYSVAQLPVPRPARARQLTPTSR